MVAPDPRLPEKVGSLQLEELSWVVLGPAPVKRATASIMSWASTGGSGE